MGVALLESQQIDGRYQSFINPGIIVPRFVTQLTGISTSDVRSAPAASQVLQELHMFLGGVPLVTHNVSFEQRFLDAEYLRVGLLRRQKIICTLRVAMRVYPNAPNHKPGTLDDCPSVPQSGPFHRALDDAEVTAGLWLRMRQRLGQDYGMSLVSDQFMQQIQSVPIKGGIASLASRSAR